MLKRELSNIPNTEQVIRRIYPEFWPLTQATQASYLSTISAMILFQHPLHLTIDK